MQNACDLLYTRKYWEAYEERCMVGGDRLVAGWPAQRCAALACWGVLRRSGCSPALLSTL